MYPTKAAQQLVFLHAVGLWHSSASSTSSTRAHTCLTLFRLTMSRTSFRGQSFISSQKQNNKKCLHHYLSLFVWIQNKEMHVEDILAQRDKF